jgi:uncharacterized lipoprotein YddW (UPF0748 family)
MRWRRRSVCAGGVASATAWLGGCSVVGGPTALPPVEAINLPGTVAGAGSAAAPGAPLAAAPAGPATADTPPAAPREFRAAWVATVSNIDWPSRPGLGAEAQRSEALAIVDRAQRLGLNALILQVRPMGDALFASTLEPWSEVLSGEQGRAPWAAGEAPWDPLAFWVREAHRRALELHAWFNPYRARHSSAKSPLAPLHLAQRRPDLVRRYGDQLWMDPAEPEAAAHTLAVIADVVRRYDIDAVHIDDYFYPYPVAVDGVDQPFPDDPPWARFQLAGGALARDDWRRAQVDALVQALQRTVQQAKPWVRVGISPFGLPRPERRPPGITGFSQYDKLYADVEKWFEAGWLDYLAPQLYWPIDRAGQEYPVLLDYWLGANRAQRHVWPGLFTSQVTRGEPLGPRAWPAQEVLDQVALQRTRAEPSATRPAGAGGHIHFSMAALMQDRDGIASKLMAGAYAQPALVPATPWLDAAAVGAPGLAAAPAAPGARLSLRPAAGGEAARRWAVWRRSGGQWRFAVLAAHERSLEVAGADRVVVHGVDRLGRLGPAARWQPAAA